MKIEVVILPVADVQRAKDFYEQAGFVCDTDHQPNDTFRIVQLTPPGSACSIIVGKGIPQGAPGSVQGTYLVVEDLPTALAELRGRGIDASEPFHFGPDGQIPGLDPNRTPYASMATMVDPEGNTWLLQEIPRRPPAVSVTFDHDVHVQRHVGNRGSTATGSSPFQ